MQLTQPLHKALRERATSLATVHGSGRRTWQQSVERIARLAGVLRSLDVQPDDRVGLLGQNSDGYIEALYACLWAGAAFNPVNVRWTASEIAYSLDDCETRLLIVDESCAAHIAPLRRQSRTLRTMIWAGPNPAPEGTLALQSLLTAATPAPDAQRGGSDLAGVLYTGGTTGNPKGVMLSHDNLAVNALAVIAAVRRPPISTALHVAPLFHVGGLSFLLQLNLRAATHVLARSFEPAMALRLIESERVTECFMVPSMLRMLLQAPEFGRHDLSSLRTIVYGAAPIDPTLQGALLSALPQVDLIQAYGQTEAGPVVTMLAPEHHQSGGPLSGKLTSAGRPVSTAEIRIVDEVDHECDPGVVGEICVRGPSVMQGYWNRPELTEQALRGGWLHSGDAGYLDNEGFLHLVDRIKDMIITGGENVYSAEVEKTLLAHPGVAQCAVVGVPDDTWGERVHAVIVRRDGAEADAVSLMAHCRQAIAGYKCPRSVEFRTELPMSAAGKVLKHVLREPYWKDRRPPTPGGTS
jgi:acyl-CoA synthetase (AMP-forming)/AMP-acid ligase II